MKTILSLLIFFLTTTAHAGGGGGAASSIVFDPTNYVQTTISAERAVAAEAQRAIQIYNQIQQYRQILLQNQTTNPTVLTSLLNQNAQDMNSLQSYVGGLGRLLNDTSQQRNMAQNRIVDIKSSGLSFDEYAKRESERIAAGDRQRTQLMEQERAIMDNVTNDAKFVQDMQAKIPNSVGLHDSARDMNTMLNKLVAQSTTLIQLQATNSAVKKEDAAAEAQRKEDLLRTVGTASAKEREWMRGEIDKLSKTPTGASRPSAAPQPLTEAQKRALGF